jgi:hypothetical protein
MDLFRFHAFHGSVWGVTMENTILAPTVINVLELLDDECLAIMLFEDALDYYEEAKACKKKSDSPQALTESLAYALCALEKLHQMGRDFNHTRFTRLTRAKKLENITERIIERSTKTLDRMESQGTGNEQAAAR